MRLAMIGSANGLRLHVRGAPGYLDVAEELDDPGLSSLRDLLERGPGALDAVRELAGRAGHEHAPEALGPAVPAPPRVLCLGINYADHAVEQRRDVPPWPEAFVRGGGTAIGPYADLVRPALTDRFDYEGELGVVIGRGGRYIAHDAADAAIAGYVVLNDASARDWQRASSQWTAGKNFDGTMPIGPEVVTADEVDVTDVRLVTRLNDTVLQDARTSQMIVDVPRAVEFFSSFTTLRPGDVIATGTPGGVGFTRTPPVWLCAGDLIEVSIDGVGTIRNRVVAEPENRPDWPWRPGRG